MSDAAIALRALAAAAVRVYADTASTHQPSQLWLKRGERYELLEVRLPLSAEFDRSVVELPEYADAVRSIQDDPRTADKVGPLSADSGTMMGDAQYLVRHLFVTRLFNCAGAPTDDRVEKVIARTIEQIAETHRVVRAIAPLAYFGSEVRRLDMGHGLTIEALEEEDAQRFLHPLLEHAQQKILPHAFALMSRRDADKKAELSADQVAALQESAGDALHFLRFFKNGQVGAPTIWVQLERPFYGSTFGALSGARWGPGTYRFLSSDVDPFLKLWSQLRDHPRRGTIRTAIRRLSFSQETHRLDDRLVDLMIGIESLILGDLKGDRAELSYRSSLRMAHLLTDASGSKRLIFNRLKQAYESRSAVAHGGTVDPKKLEKAVGLRYKPFVNVLEEYLRRAIRAILERPEFVDTSATPWDAMILGKE